MTIDLAQAQKMVEWLKDKLFLNAIAGRASSRVVFRGQVYRCNFGCGVGSEMQKDRPAVIVQNDVANRTSGNTIVIPITHDAATLPCIVNITTQYNADGTVLLDGQANASNMMCVSKARLGNQVTSLTSAEMKMIDEAIARSVNLMGYYADINNRLISKESYISKIKDQRNKAEDELTEIRKVLSIAESDSIKETVEKLIKPLDN